MAQKRTASRVAVSLVGVVPMVVAVLACGGGPVSIPNPLGPSYANVDACRGYVRAYNGLDCVEEQRQLNPNDNCPSALDAYPCDLADHYACLTEHTLCVDDKLNVDGHLECGARTCD